ncbi:MAG: FYDLN acid domain-containing protein [Bdellovibrionota bacterium]
MPAVDYGKKHICYSCATKFYDLKKAKAICPKCGADQANAPAQPDMKAVKKAPVLKVTPKPAAKKPVEEVEAGAPDDMEEEDEDFDLVGGEEEEEEEEAEEEGDDDDDDDR